MSMSALLTVQAELILNAMIEEEELLAFLTVLDALISNTTGKEDGLSGWV